MLPLSCISAELEVQMRNVDINDPATMIPQLRLKRPQAEEEDQLEKEIWVETDGKRLLSMEDLESWVARLEALRASRLRGVLLNGNHWIAAMRAVSPPLQLEQCQIRQMQWEGTPAEEVREHALRLTNWIMQSTYIVEVFADPIPKHFVSWLSENEEDRPNQAPSSGKKLWQLSAHQEGWAE
ncbi:hypothetical protein FRC06_005680 [Ceratobasidium sp. 370]|nr:hypothetical protein FRC06_005680 [Ceratobasidium sp. 370]